MAEKRSSRPKRAQKFPGATPTDPDPTRVELTPVDLDWTDPAELAGWAAALYDRVNDANAIGFDATQAPEHQNIGRELRQERHADAIGKIEILFRRARALIALGRVPPGSSGPLTNPAPRGPDAGPMSVEPFDLTKPPVLKTWLLLVRNHALDAIAAGEDATRHPRDRVLSRAEAARKVDIGSRNFEKLLEAAEMAIPPGTTFSGLLPNPDKDPPSER